MNTPQHIAKHLKEVFFGGNWTTSNLKTQLNDVTWEQATHKIHDFNTIATLTFHLSYYVAAVSKAFETGTLNAKDEYSFNHPPITSETDWKNLQEKIWKDVETFTEQIQKIPEHKLNEPFIDPKYGSLYRNLHGIIEHAHYHLGQIAFIKKLILKETPKNKA